MADEITELFLGFRKAFLNTAHLLRLLAALAEFEPGIVEEGLLNLADKIEEEWNNEDLENGVRDSKDEENPNYGAELNA